MREFDADSSFTNADRIFEEQWYVHTLSMLSTGLAFFELSCHAGVIDILPELLTNRFRVTFLGISIDQYPVRFVSRLMGQIVE
jgi:hypothetical protein